MRYIDPCEDLLKPIQQLRCPQYQWDDEDGYMEIYAYDLNGNCIVTVPVTQAGYDKLNELHIVIGQMLQYIQERIAPERVIGYNVNNCNMEGRNDSAEAGASRAYDYSDLRRDSAA